MSGGDSDRFEDIPENDVDVMKAKHKEFRRRKSTIIHRASRDKTDAAAPADTDNNESESTGLWQEWSLSWRTIYLLIIDNNNVSHLT